ncbi:MAG TPA: hypothetical protein VK765_01235 [Solirubrobacteraceae bacterium]|nr:hypothetical protein [Solirubrobacteraceae bacterium]
MVASIAKLALTATLGASLVACAGSASAPNGVASKSPTQIVAAARAAAVGAATVHVAGSIIVQGTPISFNMELVADKGGTGRISLGDLSMQLVELDGYLYVRGNADFYEHFAGAPAAQRLRGAWLKGAADGAALRPLAELTSLRKLLGITLADHGALTRTADATVAGRSAVGVSDLAQGGTVYVAATGTPYPLEIVWNGEHGGKLAFNDWNKPAEPSAPVHAISVKQLQSKD